MKMHKSILTFLILLTLQSFALFTSATAKPSADGTVSSPNIILLMADDLGWSGLGCYGSDFYETPNIDKLAAQGMNFTNGYAACFNCSPSRASIMTGQYTPRHQMMYVSNYQDKWEKTHGNLDRFKLLMPRKLHHIPADTLTLAESIKQAGYRTGMFGKWHIGTGDHHPAKRGFDVAIESAGKHYGFKTIPTVKHDPDQYLSDFLCDNALDFIKDSHKDNAPFFLYYADFLVHAPLEAKAEYVDYFSKKKPGKYHKSPVAAAMIKSLDDSVGRIMAQLDDLGIADNTFIIFNSDNGGLRYDEDGDKADNSSNWPLQASKGSEFDGGLRVPYIFRWPGKITPAENTEAIIHVDLYPTIINIAGGRLPDHPLDGIDLSKSLFNSGHKAGQRELYWYFPLYSAFNRPSTVVRRGDWKLIHLMESGEYELYNTRKDISESHNLAKEMPELASNLNKKALQWIKDIDAPRMLPNPNYKPEQKSKKPKRKT